MIDCDTAMPGGLHARLCHVFPVKILEGLAVASIARDVVVEMNPPRNHNAR